MAKKDYDALAQFIIENIGGVENVVSVKHCVTRIRFQLKDESKADTQALKDHEWIIDVVQKGGQYQVVIGNDVELAYDAVMAAGNFDGSASEAKEEDGEKKNLFDRVVDLISSVFMPVLPLLTASGVIKGLAAFLSALGWLDSSSGTYIALYGMGDALFYFLPIFIGYTSAEKFGLNKFVGMAIGASLVYPDLVDLASADAIYTIFEGTPIESSVTTTIFGIPVLLMTYTNTMIPSIVACYVGSKIEAWCKKVVPSVVSMFLVPAITLVASVLLTLYVLGPVVTWASDLVAWAFTSVHDFSPVLTGMLVGGFWQVLVVLGMHTAFTPIRLNNILTLGYDNVICCMQCVPFTTMAVVLAVYLRTKDEKLKQVALPAAISSFFGVSEPSIYGVTLPLKRPFIFTLICSSIGGGIMGALGCCAYTQAGLGLFALPAYIDPNADGFGSSFYGVLIALAVSMTLGFVLTYFFGLSKEAIEGTSSEAEEESGPDYIKQEVFNAPVAGSVVDLAEVDDEVFASGSMGKGVGIKPADGNVYAPASGVVTMLPAAANAIGITTASNAELLIHVGIDTVQLNGKGFTAHVKQGDEVEQGQLLLSFDDELLTKEGYDDTVVFVVSNAESFQDVVHAKEEKASSASELLAVLA